VAAALWAAATLWACTPALDWREVRPPGSGIVALLPCRPSAATREVVLAGQPPLRMSLHACSAGGRTWGLGVVDVNDPTRVDATLVALRESAAGNLGATAGGSLPLKVPGATPQRASSRVAFGGVAPDGRKLLGEAAVFARGTVVVQATVLGEALPADAAETFFAGLRAE
jgi:hypothetical protein